MCKMPPPKCGNMEQLPCHPWFSFPCCPSVLSPMGNTHSILLKNKKMTILMSFNFPDMPVQKLWSLQGAHQETRPHCLWALCQLFQSLWSWLMVRILTAGSPGVFFYTTSTLICLSHTWTTSAPMIQDFLCKVNQTSTLSYFLIRTGLAT